MMVVVVMVMACVGPSRSRTSGRTLRGTRRTVSRATMWRGWGRPAVGCVAWIRAGAATVAVRLRGCCSIGRLSITRRTPKPDSRKSKIRFQFLIVRETASHKDPTHRCPSAQALLWHSFPQYFAFRHLRHFANSLGKLSNFPHTMLAH